MNISETFTINYSDKIISLNANGDIELEAKHYKRALLVEKYEEPKRYTMTQLYDFLQDTLRNEPEQPFPFVEINDDLA